MRSLSVIVACAALLLSAPHPAWAERGERDLARQRYARGQELFDAGDYVAALAEFRAAYRASPHPTVLTSQAACHERLGQHRTAAELYERYLEERPDAPNRGEIEARLARIRAMPGRLRVTSDPAGARIFVDGVLQRETTPATVELTQGTHTVEVETRGHERAVREVRIEYASDTSLEVALAPAGEEPAAVEEGRVEGDASTGTAPDEGSAGAETAPAGPEPRGAGPDLYLPAWILAAAAGVCAVTAVVTGSFALVHNEEFREGIETHRDREELRDLADLGRGEALAADVLYGAAALAGITAAILFAIEAVRGDPDVEPGYEEPLIVAPAPGGGAVGLGSFRF